jgi:hypothetical protein
LSYIDKLANHTNLIERQNKKKFFLTKSNFVKNHNKKEKPKRKGKGKKHVFKQGKKINREDIVAIHNICRFFFN